MSMQWSAIKETIEERHGPVEVIDHVDLECAVFGCVEDACATIRIPLGAGHILQLYVCMGHSDEAHELDTFDEEAKT